MAQGILLDAPHGANLNSAPREDGGALVGFLRSFTAYVNEKQNAGVDITGTLHNQAQYMLRMITAMPQLSMDGALGVSQHLSTSPFNQE